MPPHVPRKRLRDDSSPIPSPKSTTTVPPIIKSSKPKSNLKSQPGSKAKAKAKSKPITAPPPAKPTLFDDLDALTSPPHRNGPSKLHEIADSEDDDDSSLSSLSDADFEDVVPSLPPSKRQKTTTTQPPTANNDHDDEQDDEIDSDDDLIFEDVPHHTTTHPSTSVPVPSTNPDAPISGELELTLVRDTRISLANALGKKGPSKLERQIRVSTHCVHVLLLMWHNAVRNAWACDPTVQGLLLSHLPGRVWDEVERFRRGSGLVKEEEEDVKSQTTKKGDTKAVPVKGRKGAATATATATTTRRAGKGDADSGKDRDWGTAAQRLEKGAVDRSQGDPLYRLLKVLSAWWKQRFRITAPGLRKWGYMTLERLDRLTKAFKEEDPGSNPEKFGERIEGLEGFRRCAAECCGSRDMGAQLFTALLRGLGLEARLVASLQPLGYGWNKLEEADPERESSSSASASVAGTPQKGTAPKSKPPPSTKSSRPTTSTGTRSSRSKSTTTTGAVTTDSDLEIPNSDNDSLISLSPPPTPQPNRPNPSPPPKPYDKDLTYPHYWTEVLSPLTQTYTPVDALIKPLIATNPTLTQSLEPRGIKADQSKQSISYVLSYSPDGTAKDVTVRYLRNHIFPGRTKGVRMPVEKIPVYGRDGKVKRYDKFDWFKEGAMRGYVRGRGEKYPLTEADYKEEGEGGDLKVAEAMKREVKEGEETLAFYKGSGEFVLERFLKREEALVKGAEVVRWFRGKGGKGDKQGGGKGEPVYLRKDVVQVKSAETWHKQGRAPMPGEQPLKRVPYRAATTNRRREIAEAEMATGRKVLQGLYSFDQTDWIIPEPIVDGVIPKNEYGNIDLFAEHMCPAGAVHVPYRGAMRVCKRLGVDYAEAVVDFEFGHRMAVPVIQGVVVAEEWYEKVMEELARDEAEKKRKEDEKRRKAALGMWRRFLMGLRIVERLNGFEENAGRGGLKGGVFKNSTGVGASVGGDGDGDGDEDMEMGGGGFIPEGYELEEEDGGDGKKKMQLTSGFFPTALSDEEDDSPDDTLMIDHGEGRVDSTEPSPPPVSQGKGKGKDKSVMSTKPKRKAAATKSKTRAASGGVRRRRRNVPSSSEEDDDDDEEEDEDEDVYMGSDDE